MEVKLTWIERMLEMEKASCIPLEGTPPATIYSAVHQNKATIKEKGLQFRVQEDESTGEKYVCRVK